MTVYGLRVHHLWDPFLRAAACARPPGRTGAAAASVLAASDLRRSLNLSGFADPASPSGMFVGAPLLAREYSSGTARFAWTQGAGRTRPTVAKLILLGLAVLASAP